MTMRRLGGIVFLIFLALSIVSPARAFVVFVDFFERSDGPVGSDWVVIDGSWEIEGNELCGNNSDGYTAIQKIMTQTSFGGYSSLEFECNVTFKGWHARSCKPGPVFMRFGLIIQKDPESYHDWCLVIRRDNRLCLLSEGVTWGPSIPFTPVVDTVYMMKMMFDGTDLKGKCWVADEPEPPGWQLSVEWTDTVRNHRVGLYSAFAHVHFDDVVVDNTDEIFNAVPEPATLAATVVLIGGLMSYFLIRRRKFYKTRIAPT
ncbi:MAG: PEP-CTERM sorting domain-containing protein [Candidatus Bathyarchaeota archaeon]|nr:MAG: PEP-CTERM sorting domain-containing protein [Candidatus Bathyarchaeota archaeon]